MGLAASRQEAFWEACGFGHIQRVKKFLESGDIDVNWVSYTHDCCPIHVASQGKTEIVKLLIDAACNVNVQDIRGNTAVHHAAMKGHADIIKMLVEAGAEVNTQDKNNWTALHCAAYWNHRDAVRVLLNLGADVNIQNKDKRTALLETARSQETDEPILGEISQMLIEAGTDVNSKGCSDLGDLEADFTGLMYAAYHNHPEVANGLIDAGCDINAHGSNLWTPLHWAADRGHEEMVYMLLGAGADPTKRGQRNELAADRAEKSDLKEMLLNAVNMFNELALLDQKSDKDQPNESIQMQEKVTNGDEKIKQNSTENDTNILTDPTCAGIETESRKDNRTESEPGSKLPTCEHVIENKAKTEVECETVNPSNSEEKLTCESATCIIDTDIKPHQTEISTSDQFHIPKSNDYVNDNEDCCE